MPSIRDSVVYRVVLLTMGGYILSIPNDLTRLPPLGYHHCDHTLVRTLMFLSQVW